MLSTGIRWLGHAGEAGNSSAMVILGRLYLDGDGVEGDQAAAAHWLERAVDAGDVDAMAILGELLLLGGGN